MADIGVFARLRRLTTTAHTQERLTDMHTFPSSYTFGCHISETNVIYSRVGVVREGTHNGVRMRFVVWVRHFREGRKHVPMHDEHLPRGACWGSPGETEGVL